MNIQLAEGKTWEQSGSWRISYSQVIQYTSQESWGQKEYISAPINRVIQAALSQIPHLQRSETESRKIQTLAEPRYKSLIKVGRPRMTSAPSSNFAQVHIWFLYPCCWSSAVMMLVIPKDLSPVIPINADLLPEKIITLCPTNQWMQSSESFRALTWALQSHTYLELTGIISHFQEEWCKRIQGSAGRHGAVYFHPPPTKTLLGGLHLLRNE